LHVGSTVRERIRVFLLVDKPREALFVDAGIPVVMADLVLINGNVLTMNPAQPRAEAIAITKDRIVKVGSNTDIKATAGKGAKILDLKGKTVLPGFIDTHIHVADFGRTLQWIELKQADSIQAMLTLVREKTTRTPKGKWILGSGWNQENFTEKRAPTRLDLDAAAPDNPVILYHQLGRACVTNSRALKLAGVMKETALPKDGAIEKDETGEPTGILEGNATDLVWNAVPQPTGEETLEAAKEACMKIVEAGITSIHWIALSDAEVKVAQKLIRANDVPLRFFLIITDEVYENLPAEANLTDMGIGGVVIFSDGYLASQTAALNQSYVGTPSNRGQMLYTQEELERLAARIHKANLQVIIHAMGDKAVDAALKALQSLPEAWNECPHRLEQAALLNRQLITRLKKLAPIVSIQPKVVESEFNTWAAVEHLGEVRARMLFPLKTLLKHEIRVVGGSDCPMEPLNPLLGLQALVTRKPFPEERLTVEEALRLYTVDAANANSKEKEKGSIEEGKLADLVVLSGDLTAVASDRMGDIMVEMTIIGGWIAYQKMPP
jgi:predicted amidohydrolase YtcJ